MFVLLAALPLAQALETEVKYITDVTSPQELTQDNGNWSRLFPGADGHWSYFRASGGDYLYWDLDSDLVATGSPKKLSGRTDLVDHAIDLCPDGTWLHVASTNSFEGANDGARIFRYDETLDKARNYKLAEADTEYTYNDAPAMCSETIDAAGFQAVEGELGRLVILEKGQPTVAREGTLKLNPGIGGSSMIYDPDNDEVLHLHAWPIGPIMVIDHYDGQDVEWVKRTEVRIGEGEDNIYWPQSVNRIEDHYFVAHMIRDELQNWNLDTGDVYISVFDLEWNLLRSIPIITFPDAGQGAMQPWLARNGDELVIIFDQAVKPYYVRATLSLDETPVDTGDTGDTGETGDTDDSGDTGDSTDPGNQAPLADAGEDITVPETGYVLTLDGSGSVDPDDDILSYAWSVSGRPPGSIVEIDNADQALAEFSPDLPGVYTMRLSVSDGSVDASDTMQIIVGESSGCGGCSAPAGSRPGLAWLALAGLGLLLRRRR